LAAALCLFSSSTLKAKETHKKKVPSAAPEKSEENYQDLINKAQNLTLQQDRLQASQVLIRGIQRENRSSVAYKELVRTLSELTSVFYLEKTQGLFATGDSLLETKPREALDYFLEALKSEEKNALILKSIARLHLRVDECEKADLRVKGAEEIDPFSPEIKLLRLQVLACQKNPEQMGIRLIPADLEGVEKFAYGLQMLDFVNRKELKRAKSLLATWETRSIDYPEVHYWKWQLSKQAGTVDRVAAAKYIQMCLNLTPRKRKTFGLDVDLCKRRGAAEAFLREKETSPTSITDGSGVGL
jgi:hypothetical protein